MLKLLERNIRTVDRRLVMLAPPGTELPSFFGSVIHDSPRHNALVQEVQRLRGGIYLGDGAVDQQQLSSDGLHRTAEDTRSWHLLLLNKLGQISACVWYLQHESTASFHDLRVRECPLARVDGWRQALFTAVESELAIARRDSLRYAEVGGWAVSKESRCTSEGLLLALAAYSLGRVFGGALGMTTATIRHSSSAILRRIGGSQLEANGTEIPRYFDPKYKCDMELLKFDSRRPNSKFSGLIDLLREKLANVPVIGCHDATAPVPSAWGHLSQQQPAFA
jgi:hypothetical protein